jgi:hypothetical protein
VNVINVYAFCNVHDVSWGTRDAEKPKDIGSTKITTDGNIDAEISSLDLDMEYSSALAKIAVPGPPEEDKPPSKKDADEAYYRNFRSYVVLAWMFCNAALVAIILSSGGLERLSVKKQTLEEGQTSGIVRTYLLVVLWSVAGLSAFKFVGASWYLVGRIVSSTLFEFEFGRRANRDVVPEMRCCVYEMGCFSMFMISRKPYSYDLPDQSSSLPSRSWSLQVWISCLPHSSGLIRTERIVIYWLVHGRRIMQPTLMVCSRHG